MIIYFKSPNIDLNKTTYLLSISIKYYVIKLIWENRF